ncbi:hypothetical protein ACB092_11G051500 [Castanea dentata]
MAAKLLHSLADDNQDLQKQTGCMTGILLVGALATRGFLQVSTNMKEKISSAKEEVNESFGIWKEESSEFNGTSAKHGTASKDGSKAGGLYRL